MLGRKKNVSESTSDCKMSEEESDSNAIKTRLSSAGSCFAVRRVQESKAGLEATCESNMSANCLGSSDIKRDPDTSTHSVQETGGESPSDDQPIPTHTMKRHPRGLCVIFRNTFENQDEEMRLLGYNTDAQNLQRTFESMGFKVTVHKELKCEDMKRVMEEVAGNQHDDFDCFVCCILSHGSLDFSKGEFMVYGVDNEMLRLWDLTRPMRPRPTYQRGHACPTHCPSLAGKPKIFFLQMCLGKLKANPAVSTRPATELEGERGWIPNEADFLLAFSTFPHYVSWVDSENGSIYVQELTKQLDVKAHLHDISEVLLLVNEEVGKRKIPVPRDDIHFETDEKIWHQSPSSLSSLRKKISFPVLASCSAPENGVCVGESVEISVHAPCKAKGDAEITISGPGKGKTQRIQVTPEVDQDDRKKWKYEFKPPEAGDYVVTVSFRGKQVASKPFEFTVGEARPIRLDGRGLKHAVVGYPACFMVKTNLEVLTELPRRIVKLRLDEVDAPDQSMNLDPDSLVVEVVGPGEENVVRAGKPASVEVVIEKAPGKGEEKQWKCTYKPSAEGTYTVRIKQGRKLQPERKSHAKQLHFKAYGTGLEGGVAGLPASFVIETNLDTDLLRFFLRKESSEESTATGYQPQKLANTDKEIATAYCTYTAEVEGPHMLDVKCGDKSLGDFPHKIEIKSCESPKDRRVTVSGDGVSNDPMEVGQKKTIQVNTQGLGGGRPQVTCRHDQSFASVDVTSDSGSDGIYIFSFTPTSPGSHSLSISYGLDHCHSDWSCLCAHDMDNLVPSGVPAMTLAFNHQDSARREIRSLVVTAKEELVVADFTAKMLLVFDVSENKQIGSVPICRATACSEAQPGKLVRFKPYAMVLLHDQLVAVTTHRQNAIFLVDVDNKVVRETFDTERKYRGIACGGMDDTLIVSARSDGHNPSIVDLISRKGKVLRRIYESEQVKKPYYLCKVDSDVLISDFESNSVVCVEVATGLTILESKTHLSTPRHMWADRFGHVYLACSSKVDNSEGYVMVKKNRKEGWTKSVIRPTGHGLSSCVAVTDKWVVVAWGESDAVVEIYRRASCAQPETAEGGNSRSELVPAMVNLKID